MRGRISLPTNRKTAGQQRQHQSQDVVDTNAQRPGGIRQRVIRTAQSIRQVVDGSIFQAESNNSSTPTVALVELFAALTGSVHHGPFCWRFTVRDLTIEEYQQVMQDPTHHSSSQARIPSSSQALPRLECVFYEMDRTFEVDDVLRTGFVRLVGIPSILLVPQHQKRQSNGENETLAPSTMTCDHGEDQELSSASTSPTPVLSSDNKEQYQLLVVHVRRL
ncbi:hypothetical protein BGW42_008665 [Actinomortierella wolfii]|nr:hypothetical protein BGW42_008665 [Actinomortierella wolfii]